MTSHTIDAKEAVSVPLALRLPPELWISILRRLDYSQLKKASRICKKIQKYVLGKEFDAVLFRQRLPEPELRVGEALKLHPLFESASIVTECWAGMSIHVSQDKKDHHPSEYPLTLDEFATSPASSQITLYLPFGSSDPVSREDGVKVVDVLKLVSEYWEENDYDDLGDHCFFEGWSHVRSEGQGHTVSVACSFGS
ncbi:hypothetical protein JCM16303_004641 [Sporobolomyces ruberrimus]